MDTTVSYASARDLFKTDDFILVNIDGEITDIAMIRNQVLEKFSTFPLGTNYIFRSLAEALTLPLPMSISVFNLWKEGHAEEKTVKKILPAINKIRSEWLKNFEVTLANLSEDLSIPSAVYLSLPRPVTEFFSELIENEQFNQYILTDSKFKIVPLDEKIFVGNVRISKEATHDSALEMESLYISKYLNY